MAKMNRYLLWYHATRPKTLIATLCPVIIGGLLAFKDGYFNFFLFIATLISATCIQIGSNLANDYLDAKNGKDTPHRLGPSRMTTKGLVTEKAMKNATFIVFFLALVSGVPLMIHAGAPIVIIGVLSLFFGYIYTGGPYPLAYNGWGEVFVFLFFGPVATIGTYYVQQLTYSVEATLYGMSIGCLSIALLSVNNLRDREEDALTKKNTLAVRFGDTFARFEYLFACTGAFLLPVVWGLFTQELRLVWFISGLVFCVTPITSILSLPKNKLNRLLGQTAKLFVIFVLLLMISFIN
jgi:1,4-dihydroxy-2-naphthoate octaprenyltransferase